MRSAEGEIVLTDNEVRIYSLGTFSSSTSFLSDPSFKKGYLLARAIVRSAGVGSAVSIFPN